MVGHEFVGEVTEVGANVADFHPGDLVSGEGHVVCGRCRHCLAGRRHLCANTIGLGVGRDGAFAEYVVLPMTNVWHHWPGIDEEVAAIFDPFGNAVHTALAFPTLGEDVLISGAGPIGLMATAVARHAGARHVVVSEPNAYRASPGDQDGRVARHRPARAHPRVRVRASWTWSRASTWRMEMSGNPAALRSAIGSMAHGGGIAILGIPTEEIALDVNAIVFKMLTIRGIYGREMYETWYKMTVMLQSGLDITPGHHPPVRVPRPRGGLRRRPARRLGQGHHGLDVMSAAQPGPAGRPDPLAFLDDEVAALRERHLYRPLRVMSSAQGPIVSVDDRRLISLSSNDYLGLTHHPRVCDAAAAAVREFGAGSGAVRTIAGTMSMHEALEAGARGVQGRPGGPDLPVRASRPTPASSRPITGETDLIVSDALNHASIIDGMRLSKAPRKVYPHADVEALREILARGARGRAGRAAASGG